MLHIPAIKTPFDYHNGRIFVTYGRTNERYILPSGLEVCFEKVLHDHLTKCGYKIILFLGNRGGYFLDEESERLVMDPKYKENLNSKPDKLKASVNLKKRMIQPLGKIKKKENYTKAVQFLPRTIYQNLSEISTMQSLVRRLMQDTNKPTAIVFVDDKIYSTLTSSALKTKFESFLRNDIHSLPTENRNILILNFPESLPSEFLKERNWGFLFDSDRISPRAGVEFHQIGGPECDEVERMILNFHLVHNIKVDWKNFDSLVNEIVGWIKSEQKSLIVLNHFLKSGSFDKKSVHKLTGANLKSVKEQLDNLVGLENIKKYLESKKTGFRAIKEADKGLVHAESSDLKRLVIPDPPTWTKNLKLHLALVGNPGTGKTTIAKLIGEFYREAGILPIGHTIKVTRKDLVAEYVGQTAIKTHEAVKRAFGGVLFVDEAYDVCRGEHDSFGTEAITTLLELMEEHRGQFVVIIAGYPNDIKHLINVNSGLKSRFSDIITLEDYSPEMLEKILYCALEKLNAYPLSPELQAKTLTICQYIYNTKDKNFGNARDMETLASKIFENAANSGDKVIRCSHLPVEIGKCLDKQESQTIGLTEKMNKLIGLTSVKRRLEELIAVIKINKIRNGASDIVVPGHYLFMGPPGVGKTIVARIMAEEFYAMGLLPSSEIQQTSASGLIRGYVGQTTKATQDFLTDGIGKLIFIDEAHQLYSGENDQSFGRDVIKALVPFSEDNRDKCCIILAGYPEQMRKLLSADPGLKSRFSNVLEFPSYNKHELLDIFRLMLSEKGMKYDADEDSLLMFFDELAQNKDFGNARAVRNFVETCCRNQAVRLARLQNDYILPENDSRLFLISKQDIDKSMREQNAIR